MTADDSTPATPDGHPDKRDRDVWLAAMLAISLSDIDAAKELYIDNTARPLRGLATGNGFHFDPVTQLYVRDASGRDVSSMDVKRQSLALAMTVGHELEDGGQRVASGKEPIDVWQDNTAHVIKELAIAQTALANGGFDRLTPDAIQIMQGSVEKKEGLAFSLDRLYSFARGIELSEELADTVEAITYRGGLYGAQTNSIFEEVRRGSHMDVKDAKGRKLFLMERNILGDAMHCGQCPRLTEAGWLPIGSMPAPGLRICGPKCCCSMDYSLVGDRMN